MSRVAQQEKIEREAIAECARGDSRGAGLTRELVRDRVLEIVQRSMQHQRAPGRWAVRSKADYNRAQNSTARGSISCTRCAIASLKPSKGVVERFKNKRNNHDREERWPPSLRGQTDREDDHQYQRSQQDRFQISTSLLSRLAPDIAAVRYMRL